VLSLKRLIAIIRPALVLLSVFLFAGIVIVGYQGIRTVQTLSSVEAERDHWQKPEDVIHALDLKNGSTVIDFGSGAGYFALKLAARVGPQGKVLAVDLRTVSLAFLRVRAFLRGFHNVETIKGAVDDPRLPEPGADAVLVANTYHELTSPTAVLNHLREALRSGGRLVIVDRVSRDSTQQHRIQPAMVEQELRKDGFDILTRQDEFIHPSGDEVWWLIIATKP
jgi:ubiquinone/menaquinone biosynthesis C-methylase UbiE